MVGRIAVEDGGPTPHVWRQQLPEPTELILGQRLRGKEIEGAARGVVQERLHHRNVVAEALAAGGGRNHSHVLAVKERVHRAGLMRVERKERQRLQALLQDGMQGVAQGAGYGGTGRQLLDMGYLVLVPGGLAHLAQKSLDLHA